MLKALEGSPAGVGFGSCLQSYGEVGEEVESGPFLDLVHAVCVKCVVRVVVVLVIEPEGDGGGSCYFTARTLDLQQCLPVVVRHRQAGRIGARGSAGQIGDALAFADLVVGGARYHVYRVGCAAHQAPHGIFQCAPDTGVELVLQLRGLVRGVVGLVVHRTVTLTASAWALVSAGVAAGVVHGAVAAADDVHLQVIVDVGVVVPAARGGAAALVRSAQRISHP